MPEQIVYWHWWVLGILLVTLEIFAPSTFFLWLGISAGIVGMVLLVIPEMSWELQLILFAVLAVISIFSGRRYFRRNPIQTDNPLLNRRAEQYVGRVFTLEEPVVNGVGKVHVDDSTWRVSGPDLPAGKQVKVVAADGVILKIEAA
ncbi:MAG TPA: NfeD family protein [Chromatiales bacterium]|nr:NfeD family protein [Thiotrichales bacterium]HIP69361.1 NfeD family protein [Chromatiales bacterium]